MTRPGVILGTAAYMSPEQAKGKTVDKRADIWAFGCVLYECLTGKRAFQGETITETVAAILKSEPDWTLLPARHSGDRAVIAATVPPERPGPPPPRHRRCPDRDRGGIKHTVGSGAGFDPKTRPCLDLGGVIGGLVVGAAAAALVAWHLRPDAISACRAISPEDRTGAVA